MFQVLKKRIKNEKGLSLVELLAVIVILGIVAAIAIPAIGNIINNSRDKGQLSDALNIIAGGKIAHIETGCGDDGCDKEDLKEYVDGKDLDGIKVSLDDNGEWVIEGYKFNLKKIDADNITEKSAKEIDLKKALDPDEANTTDTQAGGGGGE